MKYSIFLLFYLLMWTNGNNFLQSLSKFADTDQSQKFSSIFAKSPNSPLSDSESESEYDDPPPPRKKELLVQPPQIQQDNDDDEDDDNEIDVMSQLKNYQQKISTKTPTKELMKIELPAHEEFKSEFKKEIKEIKEEKQIKIEDKFEAPPKLDKTSAEYEQQKQAQLEKYTKRFHLDEKKNEEEDLSQYMPKISFQPLPIAQPIEESEEEPQKPKQVKQKVEESFEGLELFKKRFDQSTTGDKKKTEDDEEVVQRSNKVDDKKKQVKQEEPEEDQEMLIKQMLMNKKKKSIENDEDEEQDVKNRTKQDESEMYQITKKQKINKEDEEIKNVVKQNTKRKLLKEYDDDDDDKEIDDEEDDQQKFTKSNKKQAQSFSQLQDVEGRIVKVAAIKNQLKDNNNEDYEQLHKKQTQNVVKGNEIKQKYNIEDDESEEEEEDQQQYKKEHTVKVAAIKQQLEEDDDQQQQHHKKQAQNSVKISAIKQKFKNEDDDEDDEDESDKELFEMHKKLSKYKPQESETDDTRVVKVGAIKKQRNDQEYDDQSEYQQQNKKQTQKQKKQNKQLYQEDEDGEEDEDTQLNKKQVQSFKQDVQSRVVKVSAIQKQSQAQEEDEYDDDNENQEQIKEIYCDDPSNKLGSSICKMCSASSAYKVQSENWENIPMKEGLRQSFKPLMEFTFKSIGRQGDYYIAYKHNYVCMGAENLGKQINIDKVIRHFTGNTLQDYNSKLQIPDKALPTNFLLHAEYDNLLEGFSCRRFQLGIKTDLQYQIGAKRMLNVRQIMFYKNQLKLKYIGFININGQMHQASMEQIDGGEMNKLIVNQINTQKEVNVIQNLSQQYFNEDEVRSLIGSSKMNADLEIETHNNDREIGLSFNLRRHR